MYYHLCSHMTEKYFIRSSNQAVAEQNVNYLKKIEPAQGGKVGGFEKNNTGNDGQRLHEVY